MSTVETSITKLLIATRQLLESLTQWARGDASEQDVSDIYVRLGNEFNIACRAFLNVGVQVADFGDVPQLLRVILEKALSDDASQENLDRYLPSIREIIVNLLSQLKQKQAVLRAGGAGGTGGSTSASTIPSSTPSPIPNQTVSHQSNFPGYPQHYGRHHQPPPSPRMMQQNMKYPTRSESLSNPSNNNVLPPRHNSVGGGGGNGNGSTTGPIKTSVPGFHNRPPPPPPNQISHPKKSNSKSNLSNRIDYQPRNNSVSSTSTGSISPRKESNNPLATLQRSEALERRASRRYSAYQFAKLTNHPQIARDAVPDLPPLPADDKQTLPTTASHSSTMADYTLSTSVVNQKHIPHLEEDTSLPQSDESTPSSESSSAVSNDKLNGGNGIIDEPSSVGIFLQINHKVKKSSIDISDLTIASLRLQFIEKFAYSPGSESFPDIYIQDPKSGIRYELDESSLDEVKQGNVLLSLNIKEPDALREYFDQGLQKLTLAMNELHLKIDENTLSINEIKEKKEIITASSTDSSRSHTPRPISNINFKQIENIRKEVAIVRQLTSSSLSEVKSEVNNILNKAKSLQNTTILLTQNSGSSRAFMEQCHKKLSGESDSLLTNVDDLQDVIEALRKDVAQRGVRHTPRQLEKVSKELADAKQDLEKMSTYITTERPSWKKIWERELDTVCDEQQFFKLQEELVADLQDDLNKAEETFKLVEMCSLEQSKGSSGRRPTHPNISPAPADGIVHVKDAVLSEVSALQPNHEKRVEAIERAEKMRKKELEMRSKGGEFEEELEEFVGENKLKKSGGIEETERRLKLREQRMLEEQRKNDAEALILREQEKERRKLERKKEKEREKQKDADELKDDVIEVAETSTNDNEQTNELDNI